MIHTTNRNIGDENHNYFMFYPQTKLLRTIFLLLSGTRYSYFAGQSG